MGLELEPSTFKECRKIAKKIYNQLPSCMECGEKITDEPIESFETGFIYCSEYCIEKSKSWLYDDEDVEL